MSGEGKKKERSIILIAVSVGLCYICHLRLPSDVDENVKYVNTDENMVSSRPLSNRECQCLFACWDFFGQKLYSSLS